MGHSAPHIVKVGAWWVQNIRTWFTGRNNAHTPTGVHSFQKLEPLVLIWNHDIPSASHILLLSESLPMWNSSQAKARHATKVNSKQGPVWRSSNEVPCAQFPVAVGIVRLTAPMRTAGMTNASL